MNVQKVFRFLVLATLLGIGFIAPAQAALISVQPSGQSALVGGTPGVDIVLSGLGPTETVGGFSFELTYNSAIIQVASYQADPAHVMDATDLKDRMADAIARLPEREKLVVALYYYENLTLREIGEVLGVTESRISQLHTKAVLRLRGRLTEDD